MLFSILSSLALCAALLGSAIESVHAQNQITLNYPLVPENDTPFNVNWTGGVPPYTFQILSADASTAYFSYSGNLTSTTWDFPSGVGLVLFQVADSQGTRQRSPVVQVYLQLTLDPIPQFLRQGTNYTFAFSGGKGPFTLNILKSSDSSSLAQFSVPIPFATWLVNADDGTALKFNLTDSNNITWQTGALATVATGSSVTAPSSNPTSTKSSSSSGSSKAGVVGGILGGLIALVLILGGAAFFFLFRRQNRRRAGMVQISENGESTRQIPLATTTTPSRNGAFDANSAFPPPATLSDLNGPRHPGGSIYASSEYPNPYGSRPLPSTYEGDHHTLMRPRSREGSNGEDGPQSVGFSGLPADVESFY